MSLTPTNDALIVALDFEGASIKQIAHQGCIALSALLTPGAVLSLIWFHSGTTLHSRVTLLASFNPFHLLRLFSTPLQIHRCSGLH